MAVASSAPAHHAAGVSRGHLETRPGARAPRLRRLQSTRPPRVLVSAAGPGGAWLSRSWTTTGPGGWGVAPALLPTQPGERGKPHWRDAIQLARRRRSGALPPVHGPAVAAAARRDRGRARAAASGALQTAQWRRPAWRLRPASRSTGRAPWGPASLRAVPDHPARRVRLAPARPAQGPPSAPSPVSPPPDRGGPLGAAPPRQTRRARGAARAASPSRGPPRPADQPGPAWAGPGAPGPTLVAAERPRAQRSPRGRGHRTSMQRVYVGACPGRAAAPLEKDRAQGCRRASKVGAGSRTRRSPGVGSPSMTFSGGHTPSCRA